MTKKQRAAMWLEKVVLRGIEGIIGDRLLARSMNEPNLEGIHDYFEARNMAIQVYFQCKGLGLK